MLLWRRKLMVPIWVFPLQRSIFSTPLSLPSPSPSLLLIFSSPHLFPSSRSLLSSYLTIVIVYDMITSYEICFQNRSHYVTTETATQWKMLDNWKRQHQESLYSILTPNLILFGEWCYSKHSIHYTRLPDYFLAFDVYLTTHNIKKMLYDDQKI